MKFDIQNAFWCLFVAIISYLVAGIGFLVIAGLAPLSDTRFIHGYIRLGIFLGVLAFILGGILSVKEEIKGEK